MADEPGSTHAAPERPSSHRSEANAVVIGINEDEKPANRDLCLSTDEPGPTHAAPERLGPYRSDAHAVVIGINEYRDPTIRDLRFARADAEAVYEALTDPEVGRFSPENVTLLLDEQATERNIRKAIGTTLPRRTGPQDTVFIFYAGHGAPVINPGNRSGDGMEKVLVPFDAEQDDLRSTGISMDAIQQFFHWIASKQVLFFIDSCYSGMAGGRTFEHPDFTTRAALTDDFLNRLSEGEGRLIVTACGVNEVALETEGMGHGLFTHFLLEGLRGKADRDRDGLVTIDELYQYVYDHVTREARRHGGVMNPVKKGILQGQVYLAQYETADRKQARQQYDDALARRDEGHLEEALLLLNDVLRRVPDYPSARGQRVEIEARQKVVQQEVKRKQRLLLRHYQRDELSPEEYTRGIDLLEKWAAGLTEEEREIRRQLEYLIEGKITVKHYLTTLLLLQEEPDEEVTPPALKPAPQQAESALPPTPPQRIDAPAQKEEKEAPPLVGPPKQPKKKTLPGSQDSTDLFERGTAAYETEDFATGLTLYRQAAEQGNATAMSNLGFMYASGRGVPKDEKAAVAWYTQAAEQGDATATLVLGGLVR